MQIYNKLLKFEFMKIKVLLKNVIVDFKFIIIIIINSYILVTLIKLTHERLYAIYIE